MFGLKNFVFVILNLLYLYIIYKFYYSRSNVKKYYWLGRIVFMFVIAINTYYQSITLSAIDTLLFILLEPYHKIVDSVGENGDISKRELLLNIYTENTDDILTYGFGGTFIALFIGFVLFAILYINNQIQAANSLYNSFSDALELFLTSIVLGIVLDNLEKRKNPPIKILRTMIVIFLAYITVDTLSGMIKQTSLPILNHTVSHVKKIKSSQNIIAKVKGNNVIVKIPKKVIKYELDKK